jgi:hypothetical protein
MNMPKTVKAKTFMIVVFLFSLLTAYLAQIALTAMPGDLTEIYYTPSQEASYIVGQYNSTHYYLQNHTGYGLAAYQGYEFLGTNETEVLQFALNNTGSGCVLLKAGTHTLTGDRLWLRSNVDLRGESRSGTWINLDSGMEIATESTANVENVTVSSLTVNSSATSASFAIGGNAGTLRKKMSLQDLTVICNEPYPGTAGLNIFWAGPADGDVDAGVLDEGNSMIDLSFYLTVGNDADAISVSFQRNFRMIGCYAEARVAIYKCCSSVFTGNILRLKNGHGNTGFYVTGVAYNIDISGNVLEEDVETGSPAIHVAGATSERVWAITISGNSFRGFYSAVAFGGNVSHSTISGNSIWNSSNAGILIHNISDVRPQYNIIMGNTIIDANAHDYPAVAGISIEQSDHTQLIGNSVIEDLTATLHYGIYLMEANYTYINGLKAKDLEDAVVIDDSNYTVVQGVSAENLANYGIRENGDSDYTFISDCDLSRITSKISLVGSNSKVTNVQGFVTENSGSATNTTATTFVFNHGLAGTPDYVWASFNSSQVDAWIWSADSTQITVTVTNSGTGDQVVACYWKAEYVP